MNQFRIGEIVILRYKDCPVGAISAVFADNRYMVRFPDRGFSEIYKGTSLERCE